MSPIYVPPLKRKNCPFCGSSCNGTHTETTFSRKPIESFIYCQECYGRGPGKDNEKEAVAAWNRRAKAKP